MSGDDEDRPHCRTRPPSILRMRKPLSADCYLLYVRAIAVPSPSSRCVTSGRPVRRPSHLFLLHLVAPSRNHHCASPLPTLFAPPPHIRPILFSGVVLIVHPGWLVSPPLVTQSHHVLNSDLSGDCSYGHPQIAYTSGSRLQRLIDKYCSDVAHFPILKALKIRFFSF